MLKTTSFADLALSDRVQMEGKSSERKRKINHLLLLINRKSKYNK